MEGNNLTKIVRKYVQKRPKHVENNCFFRISKGKT